MKKWLAIVLLFVTIFVSGCNKEKSYIVFNKEQISEFKKKFKGTMLGLIVLPNELEYDVSETRTKTEYTKVEGSSTDTVAHNVLRPEVSL